MTSQTWLWTPPRPAPASTGVGRLLRAYRQTHGLTQQQLADKLGFDQSYVSKVESGRRAIHDVSTLRHIARHLRLSAEDVGLAPGTLAERRRDAPPPDDDAEKALSSQRAWRLTRDHLNHHRISLARAAARLYPDTYRIGNGLLTRPGWTWGQPVDITDVNLRWADDTTPPIVTGVEPGTIGARPLTGNGGPNPHYTRYTRAMRDLDRPTLFENRLSFRLLDVSRTPDGSQPELTFGHTTYFDAVHPGHVIPGAARTFLLTGTWRF